MDKNAELAQRGVLRENGKLIICLSDADIINMINLKENGDEPCDYLSNYLDELLVDLEKWHFAKWTELFLLVYYDNRNRKSKMPMWCKTS